MSIGDTHTKIPGIITQYEERTAKLKADVPQLEIIISKTWGKEDELKQLKSELAALDRKITAELAPTKCRTSTTMRMAALRISRSNPNSHIQRSMLKQLSRP